MKKITKDTTLQEVLEMRGTEQILGKYKVPCLTCPMAQMEMGVLTLENICEMYSINLKELLKEAVEGLTIAAEKKNIYLKAEIPPNIPTIRADKNRLTQVVTNLINNATKFTEKGGITVSAIVKETEILVSVAIITGIIIVITFFILLNV